MQHLSFASANLHYAGDTCAQGLTGSSAFSAALQLISHTAPETRLAAVQVLSAAAQGLDRRNLIAREQERVDLVFQKLCGVLSTDTWSAIRLEALAGLSGLHHASLPVRRQALSKRAVYSSSNSQQLTTVDASLLDSATGAFVHGTEDDVEQVRLATIAAMQSLGDKDKQFADEAAIILVSSVSDELSQVRKAALRVLLHWAAAFQQQYMQAQQEKALEQQHLQQQMEEQHADEEMQAGEQQPQQQPTGAVTGAVTAAVAEHMGGPVYQEEEAEEEGEWQEEEEGEWQQQQQDDRAAMDIDAPGTAPSTSYVSNSRPPAAAPAPAPAAAAAAAARPQRGGRKVSKKRRGDTPPWGPDALSAAVSAMHDKDPEARNLALQLALLLPPNGIQAVMGLLQGLLDCCERFKGQHLDMALRVVKQVAEQRAVYVGLAAAKIVKLLTTVADAAASNSTALHGASSSTRWQCTDSPGRLLLHEVLQRAAASRHQIAQVTLQLMQRLSMQQQEVHRSLMQYLQQQQQQQQQSATPTP